MVGSAFSTALAAGANECPLEIDLAGIALLRERLAQANEANPGFERHFGRLLDVLQIMLRRLVTTVPDQLECVMAVGDWARYGVDLRNLPYDDIVVLIVLDTPDRPFSLYADVADLVFADLGDEDIVVQFRLETLAEWQHAVAAAHAGGTIDSLGVPLLTRG